MTTPLSPARAARHPQQPLLIAAAVAVIVFCGAGSAAILGWLPVPAGGTPEQPGARGIERAMLASTLQNTAPPTLAARAENQRTHNQRIDDVRAARARTPAPQQADAAAPARARWCTHCGNIESVREITHRAQGSGAGAAGGALLGGLLGNQVGGGNGRKLATVAGAVGGAVVGNQVEGTLRATRSYEIRVRLDDGGARTFHQQSAAGWRPGDRVKVVDGALRSAA
jgi:outer membrane lipoprotein SlyB